ncbi:SemiSWEET family sugar transporter [Altibacter lentus]|uniref:SemiSWEET family sugar transporter n=1 Tax=Altibacter lentus TaxID=1223410 RepID=UPI000553E765|nr:SemiSWEET transporter [Altibacter lentus]
MELTTIIGLLAGAFTTIAVIPQIKKAWYTKKVEDVSPFMFTILILGVGLWVVYGILKSDIPIIATNGISLGLNMIMLYLMVRYRKKD